MPTLVNNKDVAFYKLESVLVDKDYKIIKRIPMNKGRDLFLIAQHPEEGTIRFYAKFKRAFFLSFGRQFPEFSAVNPSYSGYGESMNLEVLNEAVSLRVDMILFCYPTEAIYSIYPLLFFKFAASNQLIRVQERENEYLKADYTGTKGTVQETTYSVPLSLLTRFY